MSDIALDPFRRGVIYAATRGSGILKSDDGGINWREMNKGLPVSDIRSLAIDPKGSKILYAGTTHHGILKTNNGGNDWVPLTGYPPLSVTEIVVSLSGLDSLQKKSPPIPVSPEFSKCNQCHGWADPWLNFKRTYLEGPSE